MKSSCGIKFAMNSNCAFELYCQKGLNMRSFLINKNLSFYYWLKQRIGKSWALKLANATERVILIFGREKMN